MCALQPHRRQFVASSNGARPFSAPEILTGGVNWALSRMEADLTPNIQTVTPHHTDLPVEK